MKRKKKLHFLVVKSSGEKVPFIEQKLRKSLERSTTDKQLIEDVIDAITAELHSGSTTREIYKKAFSMLKGSSHPVAARYKLKRSIMELGPSGFPFERFIGAILSSMGYEVRVGVIMEGYCVNHEVDVEALKDDQHFMIECKFHNSPTYVCDVKVPLYIHSRFNDLERKWKATEGHATRFHQGWVITNTRFSEDAIQYGNCVGLKLISWDYPAGGSLKELIDRSGLHPITSLISLTGSEKKILLNSGVVLCSDLCRHPQYLSKLGLGKERINTILEEGNQLCQSFAHA